MQTQEIWPGDSVESPGVASTFIYRTTKFLEPMVRVYRICLSLWM
jgi:hypothetical protein